MYTTYILIIAVLLVGGLAGYQAASNDLVLQVFWGRKVAFLLTESICALLTAIVLMVYAPAPLLLLTPAAVIAGYIILCAVVHRICKGNTAQRRAMKLIMM